MANVAGSLDANALLRLLLNDVPEQYAKVLRLFKERDGRFALADAAVIKVVFVLCRALFRKSLLIFVKHPTLSFEDCCLSVYAELNDAEPLWTFDKKLVNQTTSAGLVD